MKLTKDKQISYRSRPEIVANLDLAAARLAVSRTFGGDKLRTGHLVNAVALWLGSLPEEELVAFASPLIRDLERHLERGTGDDPDLVDPVKAPVDRGRGGVEHIGDHGGLGGDSLPKAEHERPGRANKPARRRGR